MEPSGLIRRIFPLRLLSDCELALTLLSPTLMYSLPSGPKWRPPPLWRVSVLRASMSSRSTSLPGIAVSPLAVNRLTRLWAGVPGTV